MGKGPEEGDHEEIREVLWTVDRLQVDEHKDDVEKRLWSPMMEGLLDYIQETVSEWGIPKKELGQGFKFLLANLLIYMYVLS